MSLVSKFNRIQKNNSNRCAQALSDNMDMVNILIYYVPSVFHLKCEPETVMCYDTEIKSRSTTV